MSKNLNIAIPVFVHEAWMLHAVSQHCVAEGLECLGEGPASLSGLRAPLHAAASRRAIRRRGRCRVGRTCRPASRARSPR
eukprot:4044326-Prymnesium_polylepis.1